MKSIKIGLIGTGSIAQRHMRSLVTTDKIEVVAACDIEVEKAQRMAEKYDIPHVFEDYNDVLEMEEIDAVSLCTYNQAHCAPAVDALHAGKHVLVEKPMAATLDDAIAMTRAAYETGKILMVALKTRYSPRRIAAKQIVDSGALGDIYYAEAVACRRAGIPGRSFVKKDKAGIGTVADIGVYALDEVLHLMGHPKPVAVSGVANNLLGTTHRPPRGHWNWDPEEVEVEDFGVASVRFENGALLIFKTSWIMHMDSLGGNLVLGTEAGLKMNPLTLFRHEFGMLTDLTPQLGDDSNVDLFLLENIAFAEAIWNSAPSPIPAHEMLITNVIIQGLIDSAAAGREIEVSVPEI